MEEFPSEAQRKKATKPYMPKIGYWIIGIFLMMILAAFIVMLRTRRKPPVIAKTLPPAAQVSPPEIHLPTPSPPPIIPAKELSEAELMLIAYPENETSDIARVTRTIANLALKEPLWVTDFRDYGKVIDETQFNGSGTILLSVFGKPDAENVRTGERILFNGVSVSHRIREFVYYDRVLNPTTGKKESLTVSFIDGFFCRSEAASGNQYSR